MKKLLKELMSLCPGRLQIEIDTHKAFNELAADVIGRSPELYGIYTPEMIHKNSIIRVEALPITKPMPSAICYHYDLELALKDVLNQIKLWEPEQK
jgi:hypothetical protein